MNTLLERNYEYQRNQSTYLIRTEMNNYLYQLIIVQRAVRIRLEAANTLSGTTTEMNALRNEQVAPESDFNPIRPRGRRGGGAESARAVFSTFENFLAIEDILTKLRHFY